jgi:hypothetical protein
MEGRLEPDFEIKAWRQFLDSILHNKVGNRSFQEQFQIRDRVRRAHARRNRYNDKRRVRRFQYVLRYLRLEYAVYVAAGLVSVWKAGDGLARPDLLAGLLGVDRRLSLKLLKELEVIHLMLNPQNKPSEITPARSKEARDTAVEEPADREDFLISLKPTPVPDIGETTPFEVPEEPGKRSQDADADADADEPPTRQTNTFVSGS